MNNFYKLRGFMIKNEKLQSVELQVADRVNNYLKSIDIDYKYI